MPRFAQYTTADAPEPSRPLLQQVDKAIGFIPNLYATFAESPGALEGLLALEAGLDKGDLTPVERQLVKIAVSTENACAYCVAAHSTVAGMLRARPEIVHAVRTGAPVSDAKIEALIRFTRAVVRNRGFVPESETAAFLAAGYTKGQLLEVVGHVAAKTLSNYVHALTGAPVDAAFEPQHWNPEQLKVA
ncbi:MAG TPA: carboxymuconolactone decarboxylase family protein [Gemmatimonadales bacterium]|nr:carboxymuconolactone decarboxylase family protein [Gemmatimonadales bacterium]